MILQELTRYYQRKAADAESNIAPEGWIRRPVDYFVVLSREGECISIQDNTWQDGKRRLARNELVPYIGKQAMKHTNSGKDANLLWDTASFALGFGNKGKQRFVYFLDEIDQWFPDTEDEALTSLKRFLFLLRDEGKLYSLLERFGLIHAFEKREPVIAFKWQQDGLVPIHQRPGLIALYEQKRARMHERSVIGNCLITGNENVPIEINETVIKGVRDSQTSGANVVSFNERAFESFGKRKRAGENAPISIAASFAYITALNHLLRRDSAQKLQIGDATAVFWADRLSVLEDRFSDIFDEPPKDDPDRAFRAVRALFQAPQQGVMPAADEETRFFVLGLAPNAARISVRFWQVGTVAEMVGHIRRHFDDLEIVRPAYEKPYFSLFRLLVSTAALGKPDNIPPNLSGEVMRAILGGLPYPLTLLQGAVRRIRAEREVSYARAAIIKACLNRQAHFSQSQEKEIIVSLDPTNINPGYRLGRLFAVLEKIQEEANPGINATIRDRFYGAASSTPVAVFSNLMKLKNHHLSKLDKPGRRVNLERLIGEIVDGVIDFPNHLSLADQGRFAVGYYHQRQAFFNKKT